MHKKNDTMRVSVSYVKNACASRTMRESRALDITRVELSSSEEPCQCCWHYCLYSEDVKGLQMLSHYYCFSNWLGWQNSLYFSTNARTYLWAEETKMVVLLYYYCVYTLCLVLYLLFSTSPTYFFLFLTPSSSSPFLSFSFSIPLALLLYT